MGGVLGLWAVGPACSLAALAKCNLAVRTPVAADAYGGLPQAQLRCKAERRLGQK